MSLAFPRDLYFKHYIPAVSNALATHTGMLRDVVNVIADYVTSKHDPFGAEAWKKHFGSDVGAVPEPPLQFLNFWFGPDPVDPTKKVCETHLLPTFRPKKLSLFAFAKLTKDPLIRFNVSYEAYPHYKKTESEASCWIVMRQGVFEENKSFVEQKQFIKKLNETTNIGYEEEVSVVDVASTIVAHFEITGEQHLVDLSTRCKEQTQAYPLVIGNFRDPEGFSELEIRICDDSHQHPHLGIVGMRRFFIEEAKPPLDPKSTPQDKQECQDVEMEVPQDRKEN